MPTATNISLTSILSGWQLAHHWLTAARRHAPRNLAQHSMGSAGPGDSARRPSPAVHLSMAATSASSIRGNAAGRRRRWNLSFGSYHLVNGFILNNQLSDFSALLTGPGG